MSVVLWLLLFVVAFAVLLYLNPRVRKQAIITTTYISLTGWYYYRKWEKSHGGGATEPRSKPRSSSNKHREGESDVVYFESADKLRRDHDNDDQVSLHSVSESSMRLSETSSSGQSEDVTGKRRSSKSHTSIFRKLRKSHREDNKDSDAHSSSPVSDVSSTNTTTSVATGITTRRTFSGRKKPASWGE